MLGRKKWRKKYPLALLLGMHVDTANMENSIEMQLVYKTLGRFLKKTKANKGTKKLRIK